ncbi:SDR family oxidoreductase [Enterococcus termitis]|uniref:Oxidoreductase n=1 Tax=Enterococcus termitis TaxID=332950 RepID=A0A1E5GVP0_9ENTE|nr:SDR family oxidoreductase [Enterococcus termitis]OEG16749.1 hypothetical protein BCR25_03895 [Enterococcus termitis]
MKNKKQPIALVIGSSSGIGRATLTYLAEKNFLVIGISRNILEMQKIQDMLEKKGQACYYYSCDITDTNVLLSTFESIHKRFKKIDLFVFSAGIMPLSLLRDGKIEEWNNMINTNLTAFLHSINFVLPIFRKYNHGHFFSISSTASEKICNGAGVYAATKSAMNCIMKHLNFEEKDTQIKFTTISPGTVNTNLYKSISEIKFRNEAFQRERNEGIEPIDIAKIIFFLYQQTKNTVVSELKITPVNQGL